MQPFITRIKTNLNGVLQMTQMVDGIMMTGDDLANQIVVELRRDRDPVVLEPGTKIVGYFIRSDGYTLEVDGEVTEQGHALVTIPAPAYYISGILSIAIRVFLDPYEAVKRGYYDSETEKFVPVTDPSQTVGPHGETISEYTVTAYGNKIVIAAASCFVQITETDSIVDPDHKIPDLQELLAHLEDIDAENVKIHNAEGLRVSAESARVLAENARVVAEQDRVQSESERISSEDSRIQRELSRGISEQQRVSAEQERVSSEIERNAAELARQTNDQERNYAIQNMTVGSTSLPPYSEPTVNITNVTDANGSHKHIQFGLVPGNPFVIKRSFNSVSEMESYSGTDVNMYDFVIITSTVQDPDNAKLYMKQLSGWYYVTDLSGAQGIQGPQGIQGNTGNGIDYITLNPNYTLTIVYTNGASVTTEPIRGEKGDTGTGINGVTVNSDYTMTIYFDNNTSYTTPVSMRGAKGEPGYGGADVEYDVETRSLNVIFGTPD